MDVLGEISRRVKEINLVDLLTRLMLSRRCCDIYAGSKSSSWSAVTTFLGNKYILCFTGLSSIMDAPIVYLDMMRPFAEFVLQGTTNRGPTTNAEWIHDPPVLSDVEAKLRKLLIKLWHDDKILGIQVCAYKDGKVTIDTAAGMLGKYDPISSFLADQRTYCVLRYAKMGNKEKILEYRQRLDKTLSSRDLSNEEAIKCRLKNELLRSSPSENQEYVENIVDKSGKEVMKCLDMLRSV